MYKEEKRNYRHHSVSERAQAVDLYNQGYGSTTIGKMLNVGDDQICSWLSRYHSQGVDSYERRPYTLLNPEQKELIVREVLGKLLSCGQASQKYGVSKSAVTCWVTIVRRRGYEALSEISKRGHPPKAMGRPKKKEPQTEQEKMEEELRYLRAENAYLKKLRALVEERIARESGKSPEPSKD
jgi:transposase